MKKNLKIVITIGITILVLSSCVSYNLMTDTTVIETTVTETEVETETEAETEATTEAETAPQLSMEQRNAISKAQNYLKLTAFSRSGLIKQLEFEGFSNESSTFAVDNITVDWNEQAAKQAQNYLNLTSFSRSGLMDQLKYEGFSDTEVEYGVTAVGY